MILVDITFANWTPGNMAHEETKSNGYLFQDEPIGYRTLVELMRGYDSASSYPVDGYCWLSSFTTDFKTGLETVHNIHFSAKNKSRYRKYWRRALKAAGYQ